MVKVRCPESSLQLSWKMSLSKSELRWRLLLQQAALFGCRPCREWFVRAMQKIDANGRCRTFFGLSVCMIAHCRACCYPV